MRLKDEEILNTWITDFNNGYLYTVDEPGRFYIAPIKLNDAIVYNPNHELTITIYDKYFGTATEITGTFEVDQIIKTDLDKKIKTFIATRI